MDKMTEIVETNDISWYFIFDCACRRTLMMTGEEFLTLWRAGVYSYADMDWWGYVDVWFALPIFITGEYYYEPCMLDKEELVQEVLDELVEAWHTNFENFWPNGHTSLEDWLGWTREEYAEWAGPKCTIPQRWIDENFMPWNMSDFRDRHRLSEHEIELRLRRLL